MGHVVCHFKGPQKSFMWQLSFCCYPTRFQMLMPNVGALGTVETQREYISCNAVQMLRRGCITK